MAVPPVLIHDTIKTIKSLKDKKDPRLIPTSLIKINDSKFAIPLTLLLNQSITHSVIGIFVDFQKAFDTVPHNLLLQKLSHYGIRGCIQDWFKSYLTSRTQSTIYD